MLALAITLSVIIIIALLRFGVIVEYSDGGVRLWAKAGFIKYELLRDDQKKKLKKPKKERDLKEMMPGSFSEFMDMLKTVLKALGRLKRRLLIKQLTLYYTTAGEDPSTIALTYGAANAAIGLIVPMIRNNFRVRRLDLRTFVNFCSAEQRIYAKCTISIAVWEVFYILFALWPLVTSMFKRKAPGVPSQKTKPIPNETARLDNEIKQYNRKDGENNGKQSDQRINGNNNAKNEGNG
jgi:hypothetical protein